MDLEWEAEFGEGGGGGAADGDGVSDVLVWACLGGGDGGFDLDPGVLGCGGEDEQEEDEKGEEAGHVSAVGIRRGK